MMMPNLISLSIPLPEFSITSPQILCLNAIPLNVAIDRADGTYSYQWKDANGAIISNTDNANISLSGTYTIMATTTDGRIVLEHRIWSSMNPIQRLYEKIL